MFSSRNKKNIDTFWLEKEPYQELWTCTLSKNPIMMMIYDSNCAKNISSLFSISCLV